jgi:hypothetical protein
VNLHSTMTLLLAAGVLVGCFEKVDTGLSDMDGDGLTYDEELDLGTDPAMADSDSDGLDDGDEADYGTDPTVADSDGDTYLDGEEVDAGTNPLYEYSHPYTGGYNVGYCDTPPVPTGPTGACSFTHGGSTYNWTCYQIGDVPENFSLIDQYGEYVDLYSFCGQHITLTSGAFW